MADAGWYPDPQDPQTQHWFDGQNWTGHRRPDPAGATPAPGTPAAEETVRRGDLAGASGATEQFAPPAWQPQAPTQQWQPQAATQQWQPQPDPTAWHGASDGGWAGTPSAPPAGRPRRRTPLIVAGVAVVAVAAGVTTYLVWPGDDAPSITYAGKEISGAADTLSAAEKSVAAAVKERHGASGEDTRCYFAKPKKAASGDKASDVDDSLRCGPVLFVDGEKSAAYLRIPLSDSPDGGKVKLTAADVRDGQPSAVGDDLELVRPDGKTAPAGSGGLSVPAPPPVEKDALVTAALSDTSALDRVDATMASRHARVTLTRAGTITRYGNGDDARSAPAGQKLIAFAVTYGTGDIDNRDSTTAAKLVVDGGTPRTIPTAGSGSFVIAAVPTSAKATISLDADGYRQTLSLPDGRTGSGNIAVLRRTGRIGFSSKTAAVPMVFSRGGQQASATFRTTQSLASLDFWAPGDTSVHGRTPNRAILTVRISYVSSVTPGKRYEMDPRLLRLRIGGSFVKARNIAPKGRVLNVFDVPANFKSGTLQVTGSARIDDITARVRTTTSFPIRISG